MSDYNISEKQLNADVSKAQKYKDIVMIISQKKECSTLEQERCKSPQKICVKVQHGAETYETKKND